MERAVAAQFVRDSPGGPATDRTEPFVWLWTPEAIGFPTRYHGTWARDVRKITLASGEKKNDLFDFLPPSPKKVINSLSMICIIFVSMIQETASAVPPTFRQGWWVPRILKSLQHLSWQHVTMVGLQMSCFLNRGGHKLVGPGTHQIHSNHNKIDEHLLAYDHDSYICLLYLNS